MAKRTTHRSSKGTKLYAVRDKSGKFKDIQTYKRAHSADLRKKGTKSDAANPNRGRAPRPISIRHPEVRAITSAHAYSS